MQTTVGWLTLAVLSGFLSNACATRAPEPAESPAAAPAAKSGAAEVQKPEPVASAPEAAKPEPTAAQPTTDSGSSDSTELRKASRPPAELITGGNVVYVFNFNTSEAGTAAKERCQQENPDAPPALRACLEKAREKVAVEFIRFWKNPAGEYWWITYNRYKGNLLKWNRIQFLPGKETDSTIELNLIGKDKGIAPMARVPKSLSIELPNDYSIVVHHPEYGQMVYDAKIGLMAPEQQ